MKTHRLAAVLACWSVAVAGCSPGTAIRCALTDLLTEGPGRRSRRRQAVDRAAGRAQPAPRHPFEYARTHDFRIDDFIEATERFLELGVSKSAIAKITGVSRTTLYSFMSTRGLASGLVRAPDMLPAAAVQPPLTFKRWCPSALLHDVVSVSIGARVCVRRLWGVTAGQTAPGPGRARGIHRVPS